VPNPPWVPLLESRFEPVVVVAGSLVSRANELLVGTRHHGFGTKRPDLDLTPALVGSMQDFQEQRADRDDPATVAVLTSPEISIRP